MVDSSSQWNDIDGVKESRDGGNSRLPRLMTGDPLGAPRSFPRAIPGPLELLHNIPGVTFQIG